MAILSTSNSQLLTPERKGWRIAKKKHWPPHLSGSTHFRYFHPLWSDAVLWKRPVRYIWECDDTIYLGVCTRHLSAKHHFRLLSPHHPTQRWQRLPGHILLRIDVFIAPHAYVPALWVVWSEDEDQHVKDIEDRRYKISQCAFFLFGCLKLTSTSALSWLKTIKRDIPIPPLPEQVSAVYSLILITDITQVINHDKPDV